MVFLLDKNEIGFPDPRQGEEDGLFAVGGDLSPERLLLAYSHGIFPWYAFRAEDTCPELIDPATGKPYIQWWCPMKRFVIKPDDIHISHSMRPLLHKVQTGEIQVTVNADFERVIDLCGSLREDNEGAWLGPEMKAAYIELKNRGFAVSIEVWEGEELIGGLYGVSIGRGFFGESMFSLKPSGSKIALIMLAKYLRSTEIKLIDCQFETAHLKKMGGHYISYAEYLHLINPGAYPDPVETTDDTPSQKS